VRLSFALEFNDVRLRVLRLRDAKALEHLVLSNRSWLRPWEATLPDAPMNFDIKAQIRGLLRQMDQDQGIPFAIEYRGQVVGQLNVANILYGSVSSAIIGYWVAPEVAGRGITPTAVALAIDYLFNQLGLHRVEIAIRPENTASLRVVEKLGLRFEGTKERYIHINGDWRDHYMFAVTAEEIRGGLLNRFAQSKVPAMKYPWN